MPARLSVVVVAWNGADRLERSLPALVSELGADDELIVVDNDSADGSAETAERLAPDATVIRAGTNLGFAGGCNRGAQAASGDLIVLLNQDSVVAPGFGAAIRRPLDEARGWDAWQPLVTMDDGARINTAGGIVHFTAISWTGRFGEPADTPLEPGEVAFASGACLAVPAGVWRRSGGMDEDFFLYHEDVEFSLRLRLHGGRIGVEPSARVEHEYEFGRTPSKWRMLERNRWATILRTYPAALLLALLPGLLATEIALLAVAAAGGWGGQKLAALADVARGLPSLLRQRRELQAGRAVSAAEFASYLTPELSSPFLGAVGRSRAVGAALRAYWSVVATALDRPASASESQAANSSPPASGGTTRGSA